VETGARGIVICQNPIGEINFVQTFLDHKFSSICSVIKKSFSTLLLKDQHVAFQALYHSFQARADYWLSTNLPSHTAPLAAKIDTCLKDMLVELASFPLFTPLTDGSPFPTLTGDRVCLKTKDSGLGFRPLADRSLFVNSINLTLPQALDRVDSHGTVTPGLWNSLSWCLGAGSFNSENRDTCWSFLHDSESTYGAERLASIARIKVDHANLCQTLGKNVSDDPVLAKSDECFGSGVSKLHRTINGTLRALSAEVLKLRARTECSKDDQRRVALQSADVFSNSYPVQIDSRIRLTADEAKIALQRKLGLPLSILHGSVGKRIHSSGKSRQLRVDRWGRNVAAAPGVKGDHARTTHDSMVTYVVGLLKDNGIVSRGGGFGSVKGIFSKSIDQSKISPEDQRVCQGIIPDVLINARHAPRQKGFHDDNKLHDCVTLGELKTTSTQLESVEERARRIDPDIEKAAAKLDRKYPGSTVLEEKRKYGRGGKYLALVSGSLGNLSSDFLVVVEFIASIQAIRARQWRTTSKEQLFSMNRRFLVTSFGLFSARLWARHIHDRFRDAVAPAADVPVFIPDPDREITRDFQFMARHTRHPGSRWSRA
jgi:hypothetical protein